jgi:hypothetical protein
MSTGGIKELMAEVLKELPQPRTADTIDEVFLAIEKHPAWLGRYESLVERHGRVTINTFSDWWIARLEERKGETSVKASSKLIDMYSKLGGKEKKVGKKLKAQEALDAMSAYYQSNRETFPAYVRTHRPLILEMIADGMPAEEAFTRAMVKKEG